MKRYCLYILFVLLSSVMQGQGDTIGPVHITRMYALSDDYSEVVKVDFDTLIGGFQEYRLADKLTPLYNSLGNYGLPLQEIDFFRRNSNPDQYLYRFLGPYMHHTGNSIFIDTQVPFTELRFNFGGPRSLAEQTLSVRHSQNVNRYLNIGLDLDVVNSLGQYSYQSTDNKAFTFHSSYLGTRYRAFAAWSLNNHTRLENGGIIFEDAEVTGIDDPSFLEGYDTRDVPVNLGRLSSAESVLKNRNLLLVQRLRIGGGGNTEKADSAKVETNRGVEGTFSHILTLDKTRSSYTDNMPFGGYYDTAYISNDTNSLPTNDSLFFRVLKNTIRFDFGTSEAARFKLGIGVGIRNEMNLYSQVVPTYDSLFADTATWNNSSNAVIGSIYNRIGDKFGWEAQGELYITGYRAGDLIFKGSITKSFGEGGDAAFIRGRGLFSSSTPSWWQNNWGSNHFAWTNQFSKEIRAEAGGDLSIPGFRFNLSADYGLITNYIYFGRDAVPVQYDGSISLLTVRLNKNFVFWKMHFNNRFILQSVSHAEIIPLPLFAGKSSLFFDHEFNFKSTGGKLQVEIGVEAIYHTSYYAPAYMPATGTYYNQERTKIGNYPFANVFVNLKLKRTRIFVSFDHVNQGLTGYNYFMSAGYPMPVRTLKYGVAWTFYN